MSRSKKPEKFANPAVLIIGGGLAGLTLTAHLSRRGVPVMCLDREPEFKSGTRDVRTTAISYGSHFVLEAAGVWDEIKNKSCPIREIQILDGGSPVLLDFLSADVGDKAFGFIVENDDLRRALNTAIQKSSATHLNNAEVIAIKTDADKSTVTLKDGREFSAPLIIGADGKNSSVRKYMNVNTHGWSYDQIAFVCCVTHQNPHHNIAIEHFRSEGPFAVLPMRDDAGGRHRSAIVWTMHGREAEIFKTCDDAVFVSALAARMPDFYGDIALASGRAAWPLLLNHAHDYVGARCVLINEAAHAMHPIAGQGLNIGMRDIQTLSDMIFAAYTSGKDVGAADVLADYQRARKLDTILMMAATDGLNTLFSNPNPFLSVLRKVGIRAVHHLPPVKQFFMRQAMGLKTTT
jgi:2-octaprenyl-6-methoxyphenol hydroxylase